MHSITKKWLYTQYITKKRSTHDIAEEVGTYANKIRRELKKFGIPLRSKSEAQKAALATGRSEHPTEGKERSEETRIKISEKMVETWESMSDKERERRSEMSRKQYESMTEAEKQELHKKAGEAVREASKFGSKLEQFLLKALHDKGYKVYFHKEGVVANDDLEVDLYLPELKVAIEIDGPAHFLPIWGQDSLKRHQTADRRKTGLLIGSGHVLIRIKHMTKHLSKHHEYKALEAVVGALETIEKKFPPQSKRLIEIEVS